MELEEALSAIQSCQSLDEATDVLTRIVGDYGFSSFTFIDLGDQTSDVPWFITTVENGFFSDYLTHDLVKHDPMQPVVRKVNLPFTWHEVVCRPGERDKKSHGNEVMDLAYDNHYRDGLVVPFHFVDAQGRPNSAAATFFWVDSDEDFKATVLAHKHSMHLIMMYWSQHAMTLATKERKVRDKFRNDNGEKIVGDVLSVRERDVLSWAAQGKTVSETSTILHIADDTVKTHLKKSMRKLGATNKTHAVVKALYLGHIYY